MNIGFMPQEMIAAIIEGVITSLVPGGTLLAAAVGGVVKGIQGESDSCEQNARKELSKVFSEINKDTNFEFNFDLPEFLSGKNINSEEFILKIFSEKAKELFCAELFSFATSKLDGFDDTTFPFEDFAEKVIEKYKAAAKKNTQFAAYITGVEKFSDAPVYCANWMYVNSFISPMFLHSEKTNNYDPRVCLKNLYVMPNCMKAITRNTEFVDANLENKIGAFLTTGSEKFLFIEGDAGTGKTTLSAWLNYHHALKDDTAKKLFGDRPLLTVRLRDLDKDVIKSRDKGLIGAIAQYTNTGTKNLVALENLYPNAVIILDGFDELCMIESSLKDTKVFSNLKNYNFQFIVTSRHDFLKFDELDNSRISYTHLRITHFDTALRKTWLEYYTSPDRCNKQVNCEIRAFICKEDSEEEWRVCDTPMTLYMLCAKEGVSDCLENPWQLFNKIFFDLSDTEYNGETHDIIELRDSLYRISEEIAYKMYMSKNARLYVCKDDISEIITKIGITEEDDSHKILKRCYALCCYWKADASDGAAEFLHNNIRDFFLAEKIYREAEKIFKNDYNVDKAATKLCELFRYGALEKKVCDFIRLRAKYNKEHNESDFAAALYQRERVKQNGRYSDILLSVCKHGILNSGALTVERDISDTIKNILIACVQLFKSTFEAHRNENDKNDLIDWSQKTRPAGKGLLGNNPTFLTFFDSIFGIFNSVVFINDLGRFGKFNYMYLLGADLTRADLRYADLSYAVLSRAVLSCADLRGADLRYADLSYADLRYADLRDADLSRADLRDADLSRADLRYAVLSDADLRGTTLPY